MKEPTLIKGAVYHVTPRGSWTKWITSGYVEYQGIHFVGPGHGGEYKFHFKTMDGYNLYVEMYELDNFFYDGE
jgi:hypothetical protein